MVSILRIHFIWTIYMEIVEISFLPPCLLVPSPPPPSTNRAPHQDIIPQAGIRGAQGWESPSQGQRERRLLERIVHLQLRDALRDHLPPGGPSGRQCAGPWPRPPAGLPPAEHSHPGPALQERLRAVDATPWQATQQRALPVAGGKR